MIHARINNFALLFAAILWLLPSGAAGQATGIIHLEAPPGASTAWTFPFSRPSHLGAAILLTDNSVWFLETRDGGAGLRSHESYQEPFRVCIGDIDGDGWQDAVVAFRERPAVRIFIGRENGDPLIVEKQLPLAETGLSGVHDINGDGLGDLVIATSTKITILVQQSDTADELNFSVLTDLARVAPHENNSLSSSAFLFGDYDGNQRKDFIFSGVLYLNLGRGNIIPKRVPVFGDSITIRPLDTAADVDADGKVELLFVRTNNSNTAYQLVAADYSTENIFVEEFSTSPGSIPISSAIADDLNGDGFPDLLLSSFPAGLITMLPGSGTGVSPFKADTLFSYFQSNTGDFLGPIDLDQDGNLEWLYWNTPRNSLIIRYSLSGYEDRTAQAGLERNMAGLAVAVGDYDNDGYPDFYVVNGSGLNALFRGGQHGAFTDVAEQAGVAAGSDGISCAWGDYDNDGYADLFVAGLFLPDKLYRNNGDGTFSDSSKVLRLDRGSQRATSVCWGDVNRDGYLDLLIGNFDGPNWLLINREGGYFENRSNSAGLVESYNTESAVLVDVNCDGWLDVVTLNKEGPTRLLLGRAGGLFRDETQNSGLNPGDGYKKFGQTQAWGDFNGDGYPDLHITRAQDEDMLFINSGAGGIKRFANQFSGDLEGKYGRIASSIADFNSDGYPDLLIARSSIFGIFTSIPRDLIFYGGGQVYPPLPGEPYSATGTSNSPASIGLVSNLANSLPVAADFDLDGDLDVLFANHLPDRPSDLFYGSELPLRYMQNLSSYGNTVTVKLTDADGMSVTGSRVLLAHSGKTYWQVVSGGSGRIQTSPYLLYSLGIKPFADSLVVHWPGGKIEVLAGPIYPGTLEIVIDRSGPGIRVIEWPGGSQDLVAADPAGFYAEVEVSDSSPLAWFRTVITDPKAGTTESFEQIISASGIYRVDFPSPEPADSLLYFFEAEDIYGNRTRLPAAGSYLLKTLGDINGDGALNVMDITSLLVLLQNTSSGNPPVGEELSRADLNRDGKLNVQDFLSLLKLISKTVSGLDAP